MRVETTLDKMLTGLQYEQLFFVAPVLAVIISFFVEYFVPDQEVNDAAMSHSA